MEDFEVHELYVLCRVLVVRGLKKRRVAYRGLARRPFEPLAVVEAMKMQNVLRAETRVVVDELLADVGDVVAADQMLMTFVVDSSDT